MFYSKTTGGFYDSAIHGDNIPSDAVEISAEEHAELIDGQSRGMRISADDNGSPVLMAPSPPSDEEQATAARAERDALLAGSDWIVVKSVEAGEAVPADWLAYRQALRDVTSQAGFPSAIEWPAAPV